MFELLPNLPLAQTEPWSFALWLTPVWFVAIGIGLGLVALLLFTLLIRVLATIPGWAKLSESPNGHIVAAVISAALTCLAWLWIPKAQKYPIDGDGDYTETILLALALFLICSVIGWAIVFCCNRYSSKNLFSTLVDGISGQIGIVAVTILAFGGILWGTNYANILPEPIVLQPAKALASIPQVFTSGETSLSFEIPGKPNQDEDAPFAPVPIDLNIDFERLDFLEIRSEQSVVLADAAESIDFTRLPVRLGPSESRIWNRSQKIDEMPIPYEYGTKLHIQNKELDPAQLTLLYKTSAPVPEAVTFLITGFATFLVGALILLQQAVAPRASAVAYATVKNELAQPLFLVLMILGVLSVILFVYLSFNTFGEDIKLLKDCGITTIMLLAAFQGIWAASSSISEEIEGKTALTILSKPIQRRSYVIGKFLGIFWVMALMFIILGSLELGAVSYKPIYDARESSLEAPTWQNCHLEMIRTVPGLVMAFMQSVVLMAISVALATRIPLLANLSVCLSIYVVGNLTTSLASSTQEAFPIVKFIASLIGTVIPILEHFNLQAAIDSGVPVTMSLLSGSLVYCLLYVLLALFLALLLFEDRDLA